MKKLIHKMSRLPSVETAIAIFLSFIFMNQPCSARVLTANIPTHNLNLNLNLNHSHLHKITFLMPHVLRTSLSESSSTNDFAFLKPQGISPPTTEIPGSESSGDDQTQTLNLSSMGFLFPTKTNLQDLELRKITLIQQELLQQVDGTLDKFGKAEGVYVGNSDDGSSYMMALSVNFEEDDDGLRLYGEQRSDVLESQVAVIGGTGKYEDANGYASVKVVERVGFSEDKGKVTSTKLLSFHVYLI